jgi:hypothetical protein
MAKIGVGGESEFFYVLAKWQPSSRDSIGDEGDRDIRALLGNLLRII